MIQYIDSIDSKFFADKRVLLRLDLNVSLPHDGIYDIADSLRITASKPTLDLLLRAGAHVGIVSHRMDSLSIEPMMEFISEHLGVQCAFASDINSFHDKLMRNPCVVLENIRNWPGEESNDDEFAKLLSSEFDIYVNEAFSVCHRTHASISAISRRLPSYGGILMRKEIQQLNSVLDAPMIGKTLLVGGAKPETKLPMVRNFLDKADTIILAGVLGNIVSIRRGIISVPSQNFQADSIEVDSAIIQSKNIISPTDFVVGSGVPPHIKPLGIRDESHPMSDSEGLFDLGPVSLERIKKVLTNSSLVIWNGPAGLAEIEPFDQGTANIARALNSCPRVLIGGGDTVSWLNRHNLMPHDALVSTAGGAMLDFLSGASLPGLVALGYYEKV